MDKDRIAWFAIERPEEEGKIEKMTIGGKKLCVFLWNGKLHATSSRCPHAGADLSTGWCAGEKLVCSYHRHRFDLNTGKGDEGQGNFIDVFPVKEENNQFYVGIKQSWWQRMCNFF